MTILLLKTGWNDELLRLLMYFILWIEIFNYLILYFTLKHIIMKKLALIISFVLCVVVITNAQDYKTGVGLRGGLYNGLTVKHFIGDKTAVEGLLSTRWHGFEITGLYELHAPAFDVDRLNFFYGAGAHLGLYDDAYTGWGDNDGIYPVLGIDGILGLEYCFSEIPINVGIDWKPSFNFIGYSHFFADAAAISIRYIF